MKNWNSILLIIILLVAWQLLYWAIGDVALRSPADTIRILAGMLGSASFLPHVRDSLLAFIEAYIIAVGIGLTIGVTLGANRLAGEVFEPILVALYSIPKVTLYPVILLLFGIGLPAKVAFGALHGIVPISLFTMNAIRNIKPIHIKTSRVLNLSTAATVRSILMRAAMPEVVTGLRVGFSLTLIGTLLGEMFGAQRGIGYLLMQSMNLHNLDSLMALTLLIILFAAAANAGLLFLEHRANRHL
jgi:NitT/TauT family transport system permease protein